MHKQRIMINVGASVLQVIAIGLTFFVLYRFLLQTIGVRGLGIWALVSALSAATRVSELGFSGSAVKYVARYLALGNTRKVQEVIHTSAISVACFTAVLLSMLWLLGPILLASLLPAETLDEALGILPVILVSAWIMSVAGTFQCALEGALRTDLKSSVVTLSALLFLATCFVLVPHYGIKGVAYAYLCQSVTQLVASFLLLKRALPFAGSLRLQWKKNVFLEMLHYGINFQITSLVSMLYDPMTKAMLAKFGTLEMVAWFEMANRMITQLRAILVSANQVLVPVVAGLHEKRPEQVEALYQDSYRLLVLLAFPYYALVAAMVPMISVLWIGHYEPVFVKISFLLVIATLINGLINPAYFANMGTGRLYWNTFSHGSVAVLNLVLGISLGTLFGGMGVVAGWAIAFSGGSSIVLIAYHLEHGIALTEIFPIESLLPAAVSLLALALNLFMYFEFKDTAGEIIIGMAGSLVFVIMVSLASMSHPMVQRMKGWFKALQSGGMP